jgi:hypothetical protein
MLHVHNGAFYKIWQRTGPDGPTSLGLVVEVVVWLLGVVNVAIVWRRRSSSSRGWYDGGRRVSGELVLQALKIVRRQEAQPPILRLVEQVFIPGRIQVHGSALFSLFMLRLFPLDCRSCGR